MFKSSLIKQRGRGSLKRGLSSKKKPKGNSSIPIITIIEAEFIINLLVREIYSRGLTEANIYIYKIFSPAKTNEQFDEVGYLVDCILRGDKREYEEELKFQDLHNIALGIRWTLENCNVPLVSYQNYKDFVSNEQDWQYDPKKGSFNQFIASLFKSNQQILLSIFDLFSQLIIISPSNHNNKMFVTMKLIKSVSICIMKDEVNNNNNNAGDTNNNDVLLGSSSPLSSPFETAYKKWLKTSNNLLHLFLAYLREISVSPNETNLDPKLTSLLDNYVENRKKCLLNPNTEYYSLVDTSNKQDLGSILVKKSSKEVLPDNYQVNNGLSNLLSSIAGPSVSRKPSTIKFSEPIAKINNNNIDNQQLNQQQLSSSPYARSNNNSKISLIETFNALKRRTSLMVGEKSIEQKWSDLQNEGIDLLSEPALKLFFVFDERDESPALSSNSSLNLSRKKTNNSKKSYRFNNNDNINNPKIEYLYDGNDDNNNNNNSNTNLFSTSYLKRKNFNNNSNPNIHHSNFKQSFLWEEFKNIGFKDPDDNVLSIGSTLGTSINESLSDNNNNNLSYSSSFSIANNSNNNDKRDLKFLCIRIKRNKRNRRSKNNSDSKEFQEAVEGEDDYLIIEAIDEISPFVWIENLQNQIEKMSEWVILETKVGIEFNEPDWILLNDKQKFLTEFEERLTNRHKLNQGEKIVGNNDGNGLLSEWEKLNNNNNNNSNNNNNYNNYNSRVGSIRMSILNGLNLPWTKLLLTNRLSKFNSSNQNLTNDNDNNKKLLPNKNVEKDTVVVDNHKDDNNKDNNNNSNNNNNNNNNDNNFEIIIEEKEDSKDLQKDDDDDDDNNDKDDLYDYYTNENYSSPYINNDNDDNDGDNDDGSNKVDMKNNNDQQEFIINDDDYAIDDNEAIEEIENYHNQYNQYQYPQHRTHSPPLHHKYMYSKLPQRHPRPQYPKYPPQFPPPQFPPHQFPPRFPPHQFTPPQFPQYSQYSQYPQYPQYHQYPPRPNQYSGQYSDKGNYDNIEEVGDAEAGASVGVGIGTTSTATPATTTKNTKIVTEGENESSGIVETSNEDDESPIDYEYQPSATEAPKSAATDSPSLPPSSSASSIAIDNYYYQYEDGNDLQYNAIPSSSSTSTTAKRIRPQNYQQPPYGYYYPSPPTLPPPHLASSVRNSIRSSNSSKSGSIRSGGYVAQSRMVQPQLLPRPKNHQTFYKGYDQTYMPTNNPTPMSVGYPYNNNIYRPPPPSSISSTSSIPILSSKNKGKNVY